MLDQPTPADPPTRILHVVLPRRVVRQVRDGIVTIYWGTQVLSFDDPALAPLADHLAAGIPFSPRAACPAASARAVDAATDALMALGILSERPEVRPAAGAVPAPDLPPGCPEQLDWRNPAAAGVRAISRPIHAAHLEAIVPVFRLAHPATDAQGRQVGEANVFPRALRREVPTVWQTCTYSGTRHRDDKPMNLTALRAMRAHWPEMMAMLAAIRARYIGRAGIRGRLTLGQIERLCIAVLALPTWDSFAPAPLDPVLSSLFRVTDGLRIVVHQMMFVGAAEPMLSPRTVVSAGDLFDYAERSLSFHSETGVCAGPAHFIHDFLSVLVDGAPSRLGTPAGPGAGLAGALDRLDPAMDYAFAALAVHAAVFAIWPDMADAWADIAAMAATWPEGRSPQLDAFRAEAAEAERRLVHASWLGRAEWRSRRRATYAEMEAAALALARRPPPPPAPTRTVCPHARALRATLPGLPDAAPLARTLRRFAERTSLRLARASALQSAIARDLRRPPAPGFALADMVLHGQLVADPHPRLQFLPEALERLTGLPLTIRTFPDGPPPEAPRSTSGR